MGTTVYDQLTVITCGQCGIYFAVPEDWRQEKQATGEGWSCPNGHGRVYKDSDVKVLKRQLEAEKSRTEFWRKEHGREENRRKMEERRRSALKGQLTKARKRAGAGMCPECKRNFPQLADHVKTKHPEFDPAKT